MFVVEHFSKVDSTNRIARERAIAGAPPFTAFLAEEQSEGRGREGRTWLSAPGGFYFSALVPRGSRVTDWSLLAPIAVADAVQTFLPASKRPRIKWPNDVLLQTHGIYRKLSGILCESLVAGAEPMCIVGIGVNLRRQPLHDSLGGNAFPPTSLEEEVGRDVPLADFLKTLLHALETRWKYYLHDPDSLPSAWAEYAAFLHSRIQVKAPGEEVEGSFLGIETDGRLILAVGPGECRRFASGEIQCSWV